MVRRAFLGLAGLALAVVGQVVVVRPDGQALGLMLLTAALVIAFVEWRENRRSVWRDIPGGVACSLVGVSLWREPRGWFFLGLAAIWLVPRVMSRLERKSGRGVSLPAGHAVLPAPDGTASGETQSPHLVVRRSGAMMHLDDVAQEPPPGPEREARTS